MVYQSSVEIWKCEWRTDQRGDVLEMLYKHCFMHLKITIAFSSKSYTKILLTQTHNKYAPTWKRRQRIANWETWQIVWTKWETTKKCPRLKEGKLIKSQKPGSSWVMQDIGNFYAPLNHISFTPESHFYAPLDHSFSPLLDHIFIHPRSHFQFPLDHSFFHSWITFLSIPGSHSYQSLDDRQNI